MLSRRTHVAIETRDRGVAAADRVSQLMAEELGWDAPMRAGEVAGHRARVEADRRAEREPTDLAAVAAHGRL